MKTATLALLLGLVLLPLGGVTLYMVIDGNRTGFLWFPVACWVGATICLIWRKRSRREAVDWDRITAEQKLWESGPLGKAWLRARRRLVERMR